MEKIDKKYRWLLDLCGYYKGEENNPFDERGDKDSMSSLFWEYDRSWVCHVIATQREDVPSIEYYRSACPKTLSTSEDIPVGIKAILISRIVHWTDCFPTDESFQHGMLSDYLRMRQNRKTIRKGKRILNSWRLERLLWASGYDSSENSDDLTEEQRLHFGLVDAVDGPLRTYTGHSSKRFSEWKAVRMIEYAGSHELTLTMVQDAETVNSLDLYSGHPEYREIRNLLFLHLEIDPNSQEARRCEYVGRYEGKYVYRCRLDGDGNNVIGPMTCIFDEESFEYLHDTQFVVEAKAARKP